jgi:hypothetical protein
MNVLLLREKVKLPDMLEQITEAQLLTYIGECIMDSVPPTDMQNDENFLLNLEQNIHDAIEILPKLKSGLDVNIRFTGITDFEYTPECIIFDLLRIPLYHGWLIDPDSSVLQDAIGNQSYNQLVDNIITNKSSLDPLISTRVLVAEEFLERTASQLTVYGLNELKSKIMDNEIGILFRNNHFLTLFKRDGEIYTLVTDHGYLTEFNIVWETLDSIEGAGVFFDANFQLSELAERQVQTYKDEQREQQMVNDYLVALSLKEEELKQAGPEGAELRRQLELSDLEVAKKLQEEEDGLARENRNAAVTEPETRNRDDTCPTCPSTNTEQISTRYTQSFASNDTQTDQQHASIVGATTATTSTIGTNQQSLSTDCQTFPKLISSPMQQESSLPSGIVEEKHKFTEHSLPSSSDCVEVVPQQIGIVDPNNDLANNHRSQPEAAEASSTLTYATVADPMRSHKREEPPNEAATSQQRQASGRDGNKPKSEKSRESTCRVH